MARIKVIVEMTANPGGRDELRATFERMLREQAPHLDGFLGSARYEVPDAPDTLVEIAEWESAEARHAHLRAAAASGAYAPLFAMLASPVRITVLRPLG